MRAVRLSQCIAAMAILAALAGPRAAGAEAPLRTGAFGIDLATAPESVRQSLERRYAPCNIATYVYRAHGAPKTGATAQLSINPGLASHDPATLETCVASPAGPGTTDAIEARFVHPAVDERQPLYSLEAYRTYPDTVHQRPPRIRVTFDALRKELFGLYGKPTAETRERNPSSAANRARSLGFAGDVKREDYVVRYLWAANGRLAPTENDDPACDCSGDYVVATLEISRSPSTRPRNQFYVVSLKLRVENPELRDRQARWNASR